jgi:hypothetical protein
MEIDTVTQKSSQALGPMELKTFLETIPLEHLQNLLYGPSRVTMRAHAYNIKLFDHKFLSLKPDLNNLGVILALLNEALLVKGAMAIQSLQDPAYLETLLELIVSFSLADDF